MAIPDNLSEFERFILIAAPRKKVWSVLADIGSIHVPQILINDRHIGGFDDLYALKIAGKLDHILEAG